MKISRVPPFKWLKIARFWNKTKNSFQSGCGELPLQVAACQLKIKTFLYIKFSVDERGFNFIINYDILFYSQSFLAFSDFFLSFIFLDISNFTSIVTKNKMFLLLVRGSLKVKCREGSFFVNTGNSRDVGALKKYLCRKKAED